MRKLILIAISVSLTLPAFAQKIKVRRVKGNQAVIEFSGAPLNTGSVYEISSESFGEVGGNGSRANSIGFSFAMSSGKSDKSSNTTTIIDFSGRYGWNKGSYEFGPIINYRSTNENSSSTTTRIQGGAFGDYNMIPNYSGEVFTYGLGGSFMYGSNDNGSGNSTSMMSFNAGPFVKWFAISNTSAVRFDALYNYESYSGSGSDATFTGMLLSVGISTYF